MDKIRFGIIGMGNMGTAHAKKFAEKKITYGILTSVADNDKDKIDRAKQKFGSEIKYYDNADELITSGIDAVIVAVPHYLHTDFCIKALDKDINVICEKPAGVYTKQVKEMNAAAKKSKALFTMMFNQRTNCLYRKMKELIENGELGAIRRVNWIITNWYRSQSYYDSSAWRATWAGEGGGVLINQCPHQLDLLQWVTGMMPSEIRAFCEYGKWHDIEVEDDVTAFLKYENGTTGVFITSTADCPGTNRFEITGDRGKLVCENDKLIFIKLKVSEREFNRTYKGGFGEPEKETVAIETDGKNEQHTGIINNFTNAVLGIEPLFVDGKEGLKGVEIMNAMSLSGWLNGEPVKLPIDDELYINMLNEKIKNSVYKKTGGNILLSTEGTYGKK